MVKYYIQVVNKMSEENNSGIVTIKIYDIEYTFWTQAKVVRKYIKDYLKDRFLGRLIIRELNQVDLSIPEENLPIEIQSTHVVKGGLHYAGWEDRIRRQLDQNIVSYGRCIFFFDESLLLAMKNAGRCISINMDWFRKYMKEEKLEVFTATYDGVIKQKEYKDFDFLSEISQTCPTALQTDEMILNKNKMRIYASIVKGYGFTQEEIDSLENDFEKFCEINKIDGIYRDDRLKRFLKRQINKRARLYGTILQAIGGLPSINMTLCRNTDKCISADKYLAKVLGIFDVRGSTNRSITIFIDRFDICKYFPGYLRDKEIWERLRGHSLSNRHLDNIIKRKIDITRGIDYYFNNDININNENNQNFNNKIGNIKINNKDQILTIHSAESNNI